MKHLKLYEDIDWEDDWEDIEEYDDDEDKSELYVMNVVRNGDEYDIEVSELSDPTPYKERDRWVYGDNYRDRKKVLGEINPNKFYYTTKDKKRKIFVDMNKMKNGIISSGGVIFEKGKEAEARVKLGKSYGTTRAGLTRKIRNRQRDLDEFTSLRNSLDRLF